MATRKKSKVVAPGLAWSKGGVLPTDHQKRNDPVEAPETYSRPLRSRAGEAALWMSADPRENMTLGEAARVVGMLQRIGLPLGRLFTESRPIGPHMGEVVPAELARDRGIDLAAWYVDLSLTGGSQGIGHMVHAICSGVHNDAVTGIRRVWDGIDNLHGEAANIGPALAGLRHADIIAAMRAIFEPMAVKP